MSKSHIHTYEGRTLKIECNETVGKNQPEAPLENLHFLMLKVKMFSMDDGVSVYVAYQIHIVLNYIILFILFNHISLNRQLLKSQSSSFFHLPTILSLFLSNISILIEIASFSWLVKLLPTYVGKF